MNKMQEKSSRSKGHGGHRGLPVETPSEDSFGTIRGERKRESRFSVTKEIDAK